MNPIFVLTAFSFLAFGTTLHAQNAILATGSDASASSGSVSYSIGQTIYINNTGTNGSVTQGCEVKIFKIVKSK